MDCEKFEPLLLDELYGELDEVTSAAVKRHVSGCARCGPILDGMRSTRSLVGPMLRESMLELPAGLEDRILSSVKEAHKVVPLFAAGAAEGGSAPGQSRASRALSWAGSWAMRPQTAMAAVFLLMIGTSAFVIRSRHSSERAAAVSVTEQGEPAAPSPPAGEQDSLDSKAAAAAHGPTMPAPTTAPPAASPSPVASAAGAVAFNSDPFAGAAGPMDGLTGGKGRGSKADEALGSALAESAPVERKEQRDSKDKAEEARGDLEKKSAPATRVAQGASPSAPAKPSDISNAGAPGGAPAADYAPRSQTVAPPPSPRPASELQDGFSAGMAAYRSRNYAEATRQFDAAARSGDQNAALWAAKSVKDGSGCAAAMPRFEAVAQRSSGAWVGHEAQLESARCQIASGQLDSARDKLGKLANVPSHAAPAQQALNELNQVASRREAERSKGAGASRPAAAAPARAPAATSRPAGTASERGSDATKANGF